MPNSHGRMPSFQSLRGVGGVAVLLRGDDEVQLLERFPVDRLPRLLRRSSFFVRSTRRSVFGAMAMPFASVVPLQKTLLSIVADRDLRAGDRRGVVEPRDEDERVLRLVLDARCRGSSTCTIVPATSSDRRRFDLRDGVARLDRPPRRCPLPIADSAGFRFETVRLRSCPACGASLRCLPASRRAVSCESRPSRSSTIVGTS